MQQQAERFLESERSGSPYTICPWTHDSASLWKDNKEPPRQRQTAQKRLHSMQWLQWENSVMMRKFTMVGNNRCLLVKCYCFARLEIVERSETFVFEEKFVILLMFRRGCENEVVCSRRQCLRRLRLWSASRSLVSCRWFSGTEISMFRRKKW